MALLYAGLRLLQRVSQLPKRELGERVLGETHRGPVLHLCLLKERRHNEKQ